MAKITFYGGVGTVTGSKYLLESNGKKVLVDCGLFQGLKELRERNWEDPPFVPDELDAVIITHAHIDHTGYLPRIVKLGYNKRVFTSNGTADLLKILLPDSGRLQQEEADYRNRHQLTTHAPALRRVLRLLASAGVLEEQENGSFALTSVGEVLRADVPGSARAMVMLFGGVRIQDAWKELEYCVRTGEPAFRKRGIADPFVEMAKDPEETANFDAAIIDGHAGTN